MNSAQLAYARQRLDAEYSRLRNVIHVETVLKPEKKPPTWGAFRALVQGGKLKAAEGYGAEHYHINRNTSISQIWNLDSVMERTDEKIDAKVREERTTKLNREHTRVLDQLILGEAKEALA